jgi:SAM-dependent methyltransferase
VLPPDLLRKRLALQRWTAHNLRLTPDIATLPDQPDFLTTNVYLLAIQRFLGALFRGQLTGLRVADLGCLEGGFALAFAQLGAEVVAIEARAENFEKCLLVQEHFGLPNLRFVQGDVKDFDRERYGEFDVVLALGILYHLDDPVAWLRQIAGATRAVLYVETHFAPAAEAGLAGIDPRLRELGPCERRSFEGWDYDGRQFLEYRTVAERDAMPWASYSNPSSFWLTRQSLFLALRRAGFDVVLEQHEHLAHRYEFFQTTYPRLLCVALKTTALPPLR